ncbi:MAG: hypothetical protein Q9219_006397 [cf. Caloplaca sp. 3 TL-2023]
MPTRHRILALIYHDFEALDLFGPLGAILPRSDYYTLDLVNVHNLPQPHGLESTIKNGIGVMPTIMSLADALEEGSSAKFDTLFIPGGPGHAALVWDAFFLQKVGRLVERAESVFTVCTGAILLAATGRLDGRKATTNKRSFNENTPKYPKVQWQKRARWVQDGKFLTSSGITAGIDAAFTFIANTYVAPEDRKVDHSTSTEHDVERRAKGEAIAIKGFNKQKALAHAQQVAYRLEYRWHPDPTDDPFSEQPHSTSGSSSTTAQT